MEQTRAGPLLLAILVCDDIIRDEETHKATLVGLFNRITAHQFPCRHPQMSVFVSLTNGHGECSAELRLVQRSTGEAIVSLNGKIAFPGPLAMVDMKFNLHNVTFPTAGRYSFDFFCNGEPTGSRPFEVVQQAGAPPGPAPGGAP